jgi:hypothetical protein
VWKNEKSDDLFCHLLLKKFLGDIFFRGAIVESEFRPQPRSRERELVPATVREHRTASSIRIYHAAEGFFSSLMVSGCSVPVIVLLSMTSSRKPQGTLQKLSERQEM